VTGETTIDDLYQIAVEDIWREIQRGHYNPHRASFVSFASMVAHEAMLADHRRRRRKMRWTAEPPMSVEYLHEAEIELQAPSWHFGADPLAVVLERESLRLASPRGGRRALPGHGWGGRPQADGHRVLRGPQARAADPGVRSPIFWMGSAGHGTFRRIHENPALRRGFPLSRPSVARSAQKHVVSRRVVPVVVVEVV